MKKISSFFKACNSSRIFLLFFLFLSFYQVKSQNFPYGFNYQGVVRDANGSAKTNTTVGVRLTVIKTSTTGTLIYQETQTAMTNNMGQFNLTVGSGTYTAGPVTTFSNITWGNDIYFLKSEVQTGVSTFSTIGTQQLMSVPYALAIPLKVPTRQIFTSGIGTYIPSAKTLWIEVEMVGGGGAGARSNDQIIAPTASIFGNLTCNQGKSFYDPLSGYSGAGGTATIGAGFSGVALRGGNGQGPFAGGGIGGQGGSSAFGGNGAGGESGGTLNTPAFLSAAPNSGSGGGGNGSTTGTSGGGGSGGYIKAISTSLQPSYSYTVGVGATSSTGGAGGSGVIIVTEHYQ